MKTKDFLHIACGTLLLTGAFTFSACSTTDYYDDEMGILDRSGAYSSSDKGGTSGEEPGENGSQQGNNQAGIVTAGEWCDLTHWPLWSKLMLSKDYTDKSEYWEFYTNNRVCVKVTDEKGTALAGVSVKLLRNNTTMWEAVTDNHGLAECWIGLYQKETANAANLQVSVDGKIMEGHPVVCPWDSTSVENDIDAHLPIAINQYVCAKAPKTTQQADIAFIVDATGSMADEIDFLKNDLTDIIGKVSSVRPSLTMRTAALFYRDEGDEYLTRHSDFTTDLSKTKKFVDKQKADGGNDYPEAVHTALERTLQDLSWDTSSRTRLAFLILDAPAHHEKNIIQSLQKSVATCAKQGIRLIPVAASGVDKNTEFMLRFFSIATGGTYVFITNDSGVGNDHIAASVGHYEVELLNQLIIRLIDYYTE